MLHVHVSLHILLFHIQWGYDSYLNTLLHQSVDYWKVHQDQPDTSCSEATPVSYPNTPTITATATPTASGRGREREERGGHQGQTNERQDIEREVKLLEKKAMALIKENERLDNDCFIYSFLFPSPPTPFISLSPFLSPLSLPPSFSLSISFPPSLSPSPSLLSSPSPSLLSLPLSPFPFLSLSLSLLYCVG